MKVDLIKLDKVPKGWKPVATYIFADHYDPIGAARQIAQKMAKESGYDSGARFGVHFSLVPDLRPYAEPKLCIEIYNL